MKTQQAIKCPKCGEKSKLYKIEAFRVFFEGRKIVNYWTSIGRTDVVDRVNTGDDIKIWDLEDIAKEPHDYHYSCANNHCHIPKDYIEKPEKYKLF